MANQEQLSILKQGREIWHEWRDEHYFVPVDFAGANLTEMELAGIDLTDADLSVANLSATDLTATNLSGANLFGANLSSTELFSSNLSEATLANVNLRYARLTNTNLINANFTEAQCGYTIFINVDLSTVLGLESVQHSRPSTLGIDTIFRSQGKIPEVFLRGCGVPEYLINCLLPLTGTATQFYSCFISYSHEEEDFAHRLHSRLYEANLNVYFAPKDIQGGKKLHEQLYEAIESHDKLLVVLSDHSIHSNWVMTEIRKARKLEREGNPRKLFPIRLTSMDALNAWECFDADEGRDLAVELREYYIPDFSQWQNSNVFEAEFQKLLRDLQAEEGRST